MTLASILDRAMGLQREQAFDRVRRSPFVPFVPKAAPARGWRDLEEDVGEMFAGFSLRADAIEDAFERWRSDRLAEDRDARRFAHWRLSTARVALLRARRRATGTCRDCPCPALPGRVRCQRHVDAVRERAKTRRTDAIAAGCCESCSEPAVKGRTCLKHGKRRRERIRARRAEQEAAGLCTHGRCRTKATRGKHCRKHAEENLARARRWQQKGRAEGRCLRCTDPATHGIHCEAHAEENRERARRSRATA